MDRRDEFLSRLYALVRNYQDVAGPQEDGEPMPNSHLDHVILLSSWAALDDDGGGYVTVCVSPSTSLPTRVGIIEIARSLV